MSNYIPPLLIFHLLFFAFSVFFFTFSGSGAVKIYALSLSAVSALPTRLSSPQ